MPFCPKCKYEFVDGIKKCNECGCDLVDNLDDITNESDEEIMDNENIINAELENANLGETYESLEDGNVSVDKEDEESRFMSSAKTYQKLSDKYEDVKSSAYTLILVGGVGLFVMILQWINVIKFPISSQTKWLFNSVLGGMFIIFLAAGIYTGRDLKRRWHIAILQVLFCIISEFKFPSGWLIYIAVELLSLIITLIIMKRCKNKADKKENHNV